MVVFRATLTFCPRWRRPISPMKRVDKRRRGETRIEVEERFRFMAFYYLTEMRLGRLKFFLAFKQQSNFRYKREICNAGNYKEKSYRRKIYDGKCSSGNFYTAGLGAAAHERKSEIGKADDD